MEDLAFEMANRILEAPNREAVVSVYLPPEARMWVWPAVGFASWHYPPGAGCWVFSYCGRIVKVDDYAMRCADISPN